MLLRIDASGEISKMSTDGTTVNKNPLCAKIKLNLLPVTVWVHLGDIMLSKISQPWRDRECRVPLTFIRQITFNSKKLCWNSGPEAARSTVQGQKESFSHGM